MRAALLAALLLAGGGAAAEEMLLKLPTMCTNGGCVPGGVFFARSGERNGVVSGIVSHQMLQAGWDAEVRVYCEATGTEEVVYLLVPGATPRQRIWVKFAGELDLIGWVGAGGAPVELEYPSDELAAAFRGFSADDRMLALSQTPETLLWIARALHARACG